jgi:transposase-like protein
MKGSKLDKHRKDILDLLDMGVPITKVARDLGVNNSTLHYWLNTRGFRGAGSKHPLSPDAERIIEDMSARMATLIYEIASKEIGHLEYNESKDWMGNSHHAAQNLQAEVMGKIKPVIQNAVRKQVLR